MTGEQGFIEHRGTAQVGDKNYQLEPVWFSG